MRFLGLGLLVLASAGASAQVTIDNIEPGTVVRYPVVALRGTAADKNVAVGIEWKHAIRFPVLDGKWAGFVQLKKGPNMVLLQSGKAVVKFLLEYQPMTTPYRVATVYVMGSDSDPKYYSNQMGEKFPIVDKLDIAMKLLQSANAEAMNAAGYGRQTFNLEFDDAGKVVVHFVKVPKTAAELRAMDNNDSWGYLSDQIKNLFPGETTHWMAMLGVTAYDRTTAKVSGTYALGGGNQAVFGTGTMQWMPATWPDVPVQMANATVIETPTIFEDSAFRQTVWANVSTAYGAMLHELGHTFGLPHSHDPMSVMSRGFDHFDRWFTVSDPPSKKNPARVVFGEERMKWDPFFAFELSLSPFFQPDGKPVPEGDAKITVDGDAITLESSDGIKGWGAHRDDEDDVWEKVDNLPKKLVLSLKDLRARLKTEQEFTLVLVDGQGRQVSVSPK